MPTIKSQIVSGDSEYKTNYATHLTEIDKIKELYKKFEYRDEQTLEKIRSRGKNSARDRINKLIDLGSPFLELNKLAAHEVYEDFVPGAGMITGIGRVEGRECIIVANDPTVKRWYLFPSYSKKTFASTRSGHAK